MTAGAAPVPQPVALITGGTGGVGSAVGGALTAMGTEVEGRCGRCDVLVNCAGTTRFVAHADLTGLDDALFDAIFAVNVRGAFATARALAPRIRVISVSPGLVDTDFVHALDPAWREQQAARTPLRRLAQPGEVATAVVVAVTQLTFTTGAVIAVDGGRPLG